MSDTLMVPAVMREDEAAEYLRVGRDTLAEWRKAKLVPCMERGKIILYQKTALDDWLYRVSMASVAGGGR